MQLFKHKPSKKKLESILVVLNSPYKHNKSIENRIVEENNDDEYNETKEIEQRLSNQTNKMSMTGVI